MSSTQTQSEVSLGGVPPRRQAIAGRRWHPFDSATGTIALGVLLTIVLVAALRLLGR